jgi:hypothetical protein
MGGMAQPVVTPKARQHSGLVLLPLALPFAILAAVAIYSVVMPATPSRAPAPGSRGALVWGNGIFTTRVELKDWLTLHGGNYEAFATAHPHALKLLAARSRPHVKRRRLAQKPRPLPRVTNTSRVSSSTSQPASKTFLNAAANLMPLILIALGLLLAIGAAAPRRLVIRLPVPSRLDDHELRVASAAGGLAVLLGVIVATQLH